MFEAVKKRLPADIAVCVAAVSDFKPVLEKKIK
jgi:phosphopantothenoylcysteine synthetase/decarboxylase